MNDDKTPQNHIGKNHTNQAFRDYDVHMLLEDEEENYLLKIGAVFQRCNGELSGETAYGTLILKAHKYPVPVRDHDLQIKNVHHVTPPTDDWQPNA
jgi:hypothetical protein